MSYKDFQEKYKKLLSNWKAFARYEESAQTQEISINASYELNAVKNATTAEQIVHLSNAYYDQIAASRSIAELYKKPKDYFLALEKFADNQLASVEALDKEVETQHDRVRKMISSSKALARISSYMDKKFHGKKMSADA
jgi:hypothetical protein